MKTLNFEQMENLHGGQIDKDWTWSLESHILCGVSGALAGLGLGGVAVYLICLQLIKQS